MTEEARECVEAQKFRSRGAQLRDGRFTLQRPLKGSLWMSSRDLGVGYLSGHLSWKNIQEGDCGQVEYEESPNTSEHCLNILKQLRLIVPGSLCVIPRNASSFFDEILGFYASGYLVLREGEVPPCIAEKYYKEKGSSHQTMQMK